MSIKNEVSIVVEQVKKVITGKDDCIVGAASFVEGNGKYEATVLDNQAYVWGEISLRKR